MGSKTRQLRQNSGKSVISWLKIIEESGLVPKNRMHDSPFGVRRGANQVRAAGFPHQKSALIMWCGPMEDGLRGVVVAEISGGDKRE